MSIFRAALEVHPHGNTRIVDR